ncbi:hypothetical protein DXV76_05380 [Rhodobacteraceae bacterium CCMM004]|nr:hypothetical protein DXV76_05380 [Rhodobacteraceae bacterium CCMM004]
MKRMTPMIVASLGLAVSATAMSAQSDMDADGDGMFSLVELQTAYPDLTEETFLTADTDADGLLNEDELEAARAAGLIPAEEG